MKSGAADTLPEVDVAALVAAGLASPALPGSGSTRSGYVYVDRDYSRSGDLIVNGNLELVDGGTLYVDGDLEVNGSVNGMGALYVSGNVTVRGGEAVISTSEPRGAAIIAGGDVALQGLDAGGYLDILAGNHGFSADVEHLKGLLEDYKDCATPIDFWWLAVAISEGSAGGAHFVNPIPGPDGSHTQGWASGAAARVALDVKNLVPGYALDPRARKVVRALEQIQYHFRHNLHNVAHNGINFTDQSGSQIFTLGDDYQLYDGAGAPVDEGEFHHPPNAMLGNSWDDLDLPLSLKTHDSLGNSTHADYHIARKDAFFQQNNPLDAEWLGRSSFQGLVYTGGDLTVSTSFTLVGAAISHGDVTLSNGSKLVFNEDYKDLGGFEPAGRTGVLRRALRARLSHRGMSLVESVIVCAIALAIMSVVAVIFQFALRSTGSAGETTDLMVANANLAEALRRGFSSSSRSGNSFHYLTGATPPTDLAVSIVSTKDATGARGWDAARQQPVYQSYLLYYRDHASQTVREAAEPKTPSSIPTPLSLAGLQSAVDHNPARTVMERVEAFFLYDPADDSVAVRPTNPVGIRWVIRSRRGAPLSTSFLFKVPAP